MGKGKDKKRRRDRKKLRRDQINQFLKEHPKPEVQEKTDGQAAA